LIAAGQSGNAAVDWIGVACLGSIVAGTLYLGTWQTQRYFWKIDVIKEREEALQLPVQELPPGHVAADSSEAQQLQHRRVSASGRFVHQHSMYIGPRSPPAGSLGENASINPTPGSFVVTPLRRADGSHVMVNRGWIPKADIPNRIAQSVNSSYEDSELVTVTGVLQGTEKGSMFSGPNDPANHSYFVLDLPSIAKETGLITDENEECPLLLEQIGPAILANGSPSKDSQRIISKTAEHFQTFHVMPWTHATYAFTWYTLAICGSAMVFFRFRKKAPSLRRKQK
jgi:surfeit locus 1 family protein